VAQSSPAHFPAGIPGPAHFADFTLAGFTFTFYKIKVSDLTIMEQTNNISISKLINKNDLLGAA